MAKPIPTQLYTAAFYFDTGTNPVVLYSKPATANVTRYMIKRMADTVMPSRFVIVDVVVHCGDLEPEGIGSMTLLGGESIRFPHQIAIHLCQGT